jgi:hypothetical protein
MNPETQKLFRINLLLQARAAGRMGLTVNELVLGAKTQGFSDTTPDTVREEIEYLTDKGHFAKLDAEISPEVESFRVTAAGRDWMATQNL